MSVGLFKRKNPVSASGGIISSEAMGRLPEIGRAAFGSPPAYVDVSDFYLQGFLDAGSPIEDPGWSKFVDQFVDELTRNSESMGGWAIPGAFHVAKDFVKSEDWSKPALDQLMERALVFLAEEDADSASIPNFALSRWSAIKRQH
jgi:hypothetical protein